MAYEWNLEIRIAELDNTHLATVNRYQNAEVVVELNESRTARFTVSIFDKVCQYIEPLKRAVKITYGPFLVFHGLILKPSWKFKDGTVEINCIDPTIKLKHHHHRYGDYAVDFGYPIDGQGIRIIIESSIPIEPQLDRDVPGNHIWWGIDMTTPQGPKPTVEPPGPGEGMWGKAARGSNVWDTLKQVSQIEDAPDFEFQPIDEEHPPDDGYEPGFMVALNTYDKMEQNRTQEVFFQFGFGTKTLDGFTWEPDGDSVRNFWVEVNPGGERFRADPLNKGLAQHEDSFAQYGVYMGWESAKANYTKTGLEKRARKWIESYAYPPNFFTIEPAPDGEGVPEFGIAYGVGDRIRAAAKRGYGSVDLTGRITRASIKHRDQGGKVQISLDCVPDVGYDPAEAEEKD